MGHEVFLYILEAQNEYMYTDSWKSVANIMAFNQLGPLVLAIKARTLKSQEAEQMFAFY